MVGACATAAAAPRRRNVANVAVACCLGLLVHSATLFVAGLHSGTRSGCSTSRSGCTDSESLPQSRRFRLQRTRLHRRTSLQAAATEDSDGVVRLAPETVKRPAKLTLLGGQRGNFLLEIGGQKFLINPRLDELTGLPPEKVHELVDFVVITSNIEGCMNMATLAKMNSRRTNFITSGPVGQQLIETGLFDNIAALEPGPGGRVLVEGEGEASDVLVLVAPGALKAPWEPAESSFVFVDASSGLAVGYEAVGSFLGPGASSEAEGIPEEALQIDYLITPDLREAGEVLKGLAGRSELSVKGVISLAEEEEDGVSLLSPLLLVDRGLDKMLGSSGESPDEFREFLEKQGSPLSEVELLEGVAGGAPLTLD